MLYQKRSLGLFCVVVCIMSVLCINAQKPSLAEAQQAKTVGDLLKVIRSAPGNTRGDFFVYNAKGKRFTAPSAAGIAVDMNALVGTLRSDATQINNLKKTLQKQSTYKRLKSADKKKSLQWVDAYAPYLLCFTYSQGGKNYKFYINDPNPKMAVSKKKKGKKYEYFPTAVYNIINKWRP